MEVSASSSTANSDLLKSGGIIMNNQTIEVTIDKDGRTTIHVMGVKGMACTDITSALIQALGIAGSTELTPEAFEGDGDDQGGIEVTL